MPEWGARRYVVVIAATEQQWISPRRDLVYTLVPGETIGVHPADFHDLAGAGLVRQATMEERVAKQAEVS
jgi:hypothetical protein